MSNILSPIVARYSLFFTLAMFSSSVITQSRQPTHLVQTLLIDAQQRYQDKTTQKMRALIRNVSTTSTSSSSSSQASSALPSVSASTDLSSSPSSFDATISGPDTPLSALELPSLPLADKRAGSSAAKSDEHLEGAKATSVFTLPIQPSMPSQPPAADASSGRLNQQQHQQKMQAAQAAQEAQAAQAAQAQVQAPQVSPDPVAILFTDNKNNNAATLVQGSKVSKSSIATLLSVTLTMIMLSLLQNKKRCIRRKARSLRGRASRRHHRAARRQHQHRDDYKTNSFDRYTNPEHSQLSRTNTLTLMDGMNESAYSLTKSRGHSYHSSAAEGVVNSADLHEHSPFTHWHVIDSDRQSSPTRSPNFESDHRTQAPNIIYSGSNVVWSLSDGHLPGKQIKDDLVTAWLTQQSLATEAADSLEPARQTWGASMDGVHYLEEPSHQHHQQRHQRQQLYVPQENQHTIINSGAQREPRQEQRASLLINEFYQGSATSHLPPHPSPSRPVSVALDFAPPHQHQHQHQLQNQHHNQHHHHPLLHHTQFTPQSQLYWQDPHHYQNQPQPRLHPARSQRASARNSYYHVEHAHPPQPYAHHHLHRYDASSSSDGHSHVGQGHRRSLSLSHADPSRHPPMERQGPTPPKFEDLSPAQQVRQEHHLRRQRYQMHHQHLQQHRNQPQQHHVYNQHRGAPFPPLPPHGHQYAVPPHGHPGMNITMAATASAYELGVPPSRHPIPKGRSAHQLAWERHCYYQQQQQHEEALAEQKRMEARWQIQQEQEQRPSEQGVLLCPPEQDLVARTSSLNRLTAASLSPQTAQALGLSRSKSAYVRGTEGQSDGKKEKKWGSGSTKAKESTVASSKESGTAKSIVSDCAILTAGRRLLRRSDSRDSKSGRSGKQALSSECVETKSDIAEEDAAEDLGSLRPVLPVIPSEDMTMPVIRRRTLKSMVAPSILSLARRCSTRFSSRPNSFAGSSSDPVINFSDSKAVTGSLNAGTSHALVSLTPGIDGVVDLQQAGTLDNNQSKDNGVDTVQYFPPSSLSTSYLPLETTPERTPLPIHRRVTLYCAKTTARYSHPNLQAETEPFHHEAAPSGMSSNASLRTRSLSTRPRNSTLRFANGRGLELPALQPRTRSEPTTVTMTDVANDKMERSASNLDKALPVNVNMMTSMHSASDDEQHADTRRQIIALLAMGRKDRISAKTGQAMPSKGSSSAVRPPTSLQNLSPLALEAQEDLKVSNEDMLETEKEDPCERIAFMLVPKSRYEFQPLVVV